jgi:hypothetical protein
MQALTCSSSGLCSSGCNGTVVLWDISRGSSLWALDLKTLCVEGMDRFVHAVSLSEQVPPPSRVPGLCSHRSSFFVQNGTLLIGTSTCEIVTVDMTAPDTAPTVRCLPRALRFTIRCLNTPRFICTRTAAR